MSLSVLIGTLLPVMGQMGILVFGIKKNQDYESTRLSVTTRS